jgi:hypothetical protein
MNQPTKPSLDDVISALERLMRLFQVERILYLIFGLASLVLFVYASYRMFSAGAPNGTDMAIVLGSTGVSAACSSRVVYFLNKAFGIIEALVVSKNSDGANNG